MSTNEEIKISKYTDKSNVLECNESFGIRYSERLIAKGGSYNPFLKRDDAKFKGWIFPSSKASIDDLKQFVSDIKDGKIKPKGIGKKIAQHFGEIARLMKFSEEKCSCESVETDDDEKNYFMVFGTADDVEEKIKNIDVNENMYYFKAGSRAAQFTSTLKIT
jgi:hypothetical protein